MALFVRSLLLWLLVLALPAQGLAAATMVFCGPNHHAGAGQAAAAQAPIPTTHADHRHHGSDGQDGQHARHHPVEASADAALPAADPGAAQTQFPHADPHKCSACASCCSGAAIPSRAPVLPAPEIAATEFVAVVPTVDPFATDGPDRPPRIRLA